jgi:hypothetical protein
MARDVGEQSSGLVDILREWTFPSLRKGVTLCKNLL